MFVYGAVIHKLSTMPDGIAKAGPVSFPYHSRGNLRSLSFSKTGDPQCWRGLRASLRFSG